MFELRISTDNAAYQDGGEFQLAENLDRIAAQLRAGGKQGQVRDCNGDRVGEWTWKDDE